MPRHRRTVSTLTSALLVGVALPLTASTTAHADPGSTIYVSQACTRTGRLLRHRS